MKNTSLCYIVAKILLYLNRTNLYPACASSKASLLNSWYIPLKVNGRQVLVLLRHWYTSHKLNSLIHARAAHTHAHTHTHTHTHTHIQCTNTHTHTHTHTRLQTDTQITKQIQVSKTRSNSIATYLLKWLRRKNDQNLKRVFISWDWPIPSFLRSTHMDGTICYQQALFWNLRFV